MNIFTYQDTEDGNKIEITWGEGEGYTLLVTDGEAVIDRYQHRMFLFILRHISGLRRFYVFRDKHGLDRELNKVSSSEIGGERDSEL